MLDPLFKSNERLDLEVSQSEEERAQFRVAISELIRKKGAQGISMGRTAARFLVDLDAVAETNSHGREGTPEHFDMDSDEGSSNSESITGDNNYDEGAVVDVLIRESESSPDDTLSRWPPSIAEPSSGNEPPPDPTMPQNRPNTQFSSFATVTDSDPIAESAPSGIDLTWLAHLEVRAREIQRRGGPGRLSFKDIERIVGNDKSKEIKGLVMSWLEWASF